MTKKKEYINPVRIMFLSDFIDLESTVEERRRLENIEKKKRNQIIQNVTEEILARDFSVQQRDFLNMKVDNHFKDYPLLQALIKRTRFVVDWNYYQWSSEISIPRGKLRCIFKKHLDTEKLMLFFDDLNKVVDDMFIFDYFIFNRKIILSIRFNEK